MDCRTLINQQGIQHGAFSETESTFLIDLVRRDSDRRSLSDCDIINFLNEYSNLTRVPATVMLQRIANQFGSDPKKWIQSLQEIVTVARSAEKLDLELVCKTSFRPDFTQMLKWLLIPQVTGMVNPLKKFVIPPSLKDSSGQPIEIEIHFVSRNNKFVLGLFDRAVSHDEMMDAATFPVISQQGNHTHLLAFRIYVVIDPRFYSQEDYQKQCGFLTTLASLAHECLGHIGLVATGIMTPDLIAKTMSLNAPDHFVTWTNEKMAYDVSIAVLEQLRDILNLPGFSKWSDAANDTLPDLIEKQERRRTQYVEALNNWSRFDSR